MCLNLFLLNGESFHNAHLQKYKQCCIDWFGQLLAESGWSANSLDPLFVPLCDADSPYWLMEWCAWARMGTGLAGTQKNNWGRTYKQHTRKLMKEKLLHKHTLTSAHNSCTDNREKYNLYLQAVIEVHITNHQILGWAAEIADAVL